VSTSNTPEPEAPVTVTKRRSPVERAIVWGGILVLLGVVSVEFVGSRAQQGALAKLTETMEAGLNNNKPLREAEVRSILGREPDSKEDVSELNLNSNAKRVEIYRWFSLIPMKPRELYVYYGTGGILGVEGEDVINVTTSEDTNVYQHGKADEPPKMTPQPTESEKASVVAPQPKPVA
jgi:hypothetical protein